MRLKIINRSLNGLMVLGQDLNLALEKTKRVSGVEKNKLIEIGKKISNIPQNFNVHKTLKRYLNLEHNPFKMVIK